MAPERVGGNTELIETLTKVKTVMDIGVFKAVQATGAAALAASRVHGYRTESHDVPLGPGSRRRVLGGFC